jgi:hypothetical protein
MGPKKIEDTTANTNEVSQLEILKKLSLEAQLPVERVNFENSVTSLPNLTLSEPSTASAKDFVHGKVLFCESPKKPFIDSDEPYFAAPGLALGFGGQLLSRNTLVGPGCKFGAMAIVGGTALGDTIKLCKAKDTNAGLKYGLALGTDTMMLAGGLFLQNTRYGKAILIAGAAGRMALDLWQPDKK